MPSLLWSHLLTGQTFIEPLWVPGPVGVSAAVLDHKLHEAGIVPFFFFFNLIGVSQAPT